MRRIACLVLVAAFQCGKPSIPGLQKEYVPAPTGPALTEMKIQHFIAVQRKIAANPGSVASMARQHGFSNQQEYFETLARISWALSFAAARDAQRGQEKLSASADAQFQQGLDQLEEALHDPEVPPESRSELIAAKGQLLKAREELRVNQAKNEEWASKALEWTSNLADESDIRLVRQYRGQLETILQGR